MKPNIHASRVTGVVAILAAALVAVLVGFFIGNPSIAPDATRATGVNNDSAVKISDGTTGGLTIKSAAPISETSSPLTSVLDEQTESALIKTATTKQGQPDSEAAIIRLQLGVGAEGIQRLVDRIDSAQSSNTEKEILIRVIRDARHPQGLVALRSLVQAQDDFNNREPLLFAAANALVTSGSEADLKPIFSRLNALPEGSHESAEFISLLVSQSNPDALPYLRSLIASNNSVMVRSTAVWMLINHPDAGSVALLEQLSTTNGPLQNPARETLAKMQARQAENQSATTLTVTQ